MGDHINVVPDTNRGAKWDLTKDAVSTALQERWPGKVNLYDQDDDKGGKALLFFVDLHDTPWANSVSCEGTFWEDDQRLSVTYGEPGAMIVEWFMSLIPENVPCLAFTEEINDPIPLPPQPTAEKVLELTGWYEQVKEP
jgi:hypothetical protein